MYTRRCSFEDIEIYSDVGKVEEESSITKMSKRKPYKKVQRRQEIKKKEERRRQYEVALQDFHNSKPGMSYYAMLWASR